MGKLQSPQGTLYGREKPATMTLKVKVTEDYIKSQWFRWGNDRGGNELPN